jgi:alcohol dehydrogenase class IV
MNRFDFATATQIIFGRGTVRDIGSIAKNMGQKALVVTGGRNGGLESLFSSLLENGISWETFQVAEEPTVDTVREGVQKAQESSSDFIIAAGGGSAIDTGKAVAALLTNSGDVTQYLEVVGENRPLTKRAAPMIAVPTTAGTGSEVTRNAVLAVPEKQVKVSLRSPLMLPQAAVIDSEMTYSLPPDVSASTGMDALAQVIEPYVSRRANPLCDLFCEEGIRRAARSLLRAYRDGSDEAAREDMAFASLMGGLALANAGLGAVHGFAGPIGGMFDAPHGAVCACLLPPVVLANARALAQREPENPALARYIAIARMVTGQEDAVVADLSRWLEDLRAAMNIPTLSKFGVRSADLDILVEKGSVASSMKANPILLSQDELYMILEAAL